MQGIIVRYRSQRQSKVGREMNFPQNKGKHKLYGTKKSKSIKKQAELQGYRRAGTWGETDRIEKGVLRDSRPEEHDSRELSMSAAAGRANIMTTLRWTNGWISAQE